MDLDADVVALGCGLHARLRLHSIFLCLEHSRFGVLEPSLDQSDLLAVVLLHLLHLLVHDFYFSLGVLVSGRHVEALLQLIVLLPRPLEGLLEEPLLLLTGLELELGVVASLLELSDLLEMLTVPQGQVLLQLLVLAERLCQLLL